MTSALPDNPAAIAARIPHQGRMCLLDAVLACTPQHIRCRASSHRRASTSPTGDVSATHA